MYVFQQVEQIALRDRRRLPPADIKPESTRQLQAYSGQYILCASCQHLLSSRVPAISRQGTHEHTRINPAGVPFRFACFSQLEDVLILGEASHAHSWFLGYRWQYAMCRHCQQHLGWYFSSSSDCFYGLILNRISIHAGH